MTALSAMKNPALRELKTWSRIVIKMPDGSDLPLTSEEVKAAMKRYGSTINRLYAETATCEPPSRAEFYRTPAKLTELTVLLGFNRYTNMRDTFIDVMKAAYGAK